MHRKRCARGVERCPHGWPQGHAVARQGCCAPDSYASRCESGRPFRQVPAAPAGPRINREVCKHGSINAPMQGLKHRRSYHE